MFGYWFMKWSSVILRLREDDHKILMCLCSHVCKAYVWFLEACFEPDAVWVWYTAVMRCSWVSFVQDGAAGSHTLPRPSWTSRGSGDSGECTFQMTEKKPCTCHTHILWCFCLTPPVPAVPPRSGVKKNKVQLVFVRACVVYNLTTNNKPVSGLLSLLQDNGLPRGDLAFVPTATLITLMPGVRVLHACYLGLWL